MRSWREHQRSANGPLTRSISACVSSCLAEQEPVDGHPLLDRKRDEKVGVRGRAALVAVAVLLEDSELSGALPLGPIASNLRESVGELSLQTINCCCHVPLFPLRVSRPPPCAGAESAASVCRSMSASEGRLFRYFIRSGHNRPGEGAKYRGLRALSNGRSLRLAARPAVASSWFTGSTLRDQRVHARV